MAKKTKKRIIVSGVAHIHSTHQNTIVSFADEQGNVFA
jgi:small subunit ribosomal protein S11